MPNELKELLLSDLNAAGARVSGVFDLVNSATPLTPQVGDVLLRHLKLPHARGTLEGIVRALADKAAPEGTFECLCRLFTSDANVDKWAVANSMEVVARSRNKADLLKLLANKKYGRNRQMLAVAAGKVGKGDEEVLRVLIDLLGDVELQGHAVIGLRQLGDSSAVPALSKIDQSQVPAWVRKEIAKAIKKLAGSSRLRGQKG